MTSTSTQICGICRDELTTEIKALECKHEFHTECIDIWIEREPSCPFCRSPVISDAESEFTESDLTSLLESDDLGDFGVGISRPFAPISSMIFNQSLMNAPRERIAEMNWVHASEHLRLTEDIIELFITNIELFTEDVVHYCIRNFAQFQVLTPDFMVKYVHILDVNYLIMHQYVDTQLESILFATLESRELAESSQ